MCATLITNLLCYCTNHSITNTYIHSQVLHHLWAAHEHYIYSAHTCIRMHTYIYVCIRIHAIVIAECRTHVRIEICSKFPFMFKCEQLSTVCSMVIRSYIFSVRSYTDSIVVAHTSHTISLNRTAKTNLSCYSHGTYLRINSQRSFPIRCTCYMLLLSLLEPEFTDLDKINNI